MKKKISLVCNKSFFQSVEENTEMKQINFGNLSIRFSLDLNLTDSTIHTDELIVLNAFVKWFPIFLKTTEDIL